MKKGYYLSAESILTIALLGIMLTTPIQQTKESLMDLHIYKKENDLLMLWVKTGTIEEKTAREGFETAFPNKSGKITMDNIEVEIGKQGKESLASGIMFVDKKLEEHELRVVVFK